MDRPWYETLFERDWHDLFAPAVGGDPEQAREQTRTEAAVVVEALGVSSGDRLLDLCCGWGRHALEFAAAGLSVSGLDISAYHMTLAAGAAAGRGVEAGWVRGDMRSLPYADGSFDAVANLFTAFGYFDDAGNQRVLEEVARVLRPGGRVLIDVINRDYLMAVFREQGWSEGPDGAVVLERHRFDAGTGRIHADWTHIDPRGARRHVQHDERLYTLQELQLRLELAGIRPTDAYGDFEGARLLRESRRLIVVGERTA